MFFAEIKTNVLRVPGVTERQRTRVSRLEWITTNLASLWIEALSVGLPRVSFALVRFTWALGLNRHVFVAHRGVGRLRRLMGDRGVGLCVCFVCVRELGLLYALPEVI